MSDAKKKYYDLKSLLIELGHEGYIEEIENYITELEQQNKELMVFVDEINNTTVVSIYGWIGKKCNDLLHKYKEDVI